MGVPLLEGQTYAVKYTKSNTCSQFQSGQDFAVRPMWLDSRSFVKGNRKETADVLGWEGTKVTNMKPITEKGRQREARASNTHL